MNWKVLKTEEDYNNASLRLLEILMLNLILKNMMN